MFHSSEVPAAIADMFVASLFEGHDVFGGIGENIQIGGKRLLQSIFERHSHTADPGEQLHPWEEKPGGRCCDASPNAVGDKVKAKS